MYRKNINIVIFRFFARKYDAYIPEKYKYSHIPFFLQKNIIHICMPEKYKYNHIPFFFTI